MSVPVGVFTVMLPMATVQVGCVTLTVGAAGPAGCGLTVAGVVAVKQSLLFLARIL